MSNKKLTDEERAANAETTEVEFTPPEEVVAGEQVAAHDGTELEEPAPEIDENAFGKGGVFRLNEDGTRTPIKE